MPEHAVSGGGQPPPRVSEAALVCTETSEIPTLVAGTSKTIPRRPPPPRWGAKTLDGRSEFQSANS